MENSMQRLITTVIISCACTVLSGQPLLVHPGNHFLIDKNQRPFFWQGDTGWELFHRLDREEVEHYFKIRKEQGYNVIQAVVLYEIEAFETPNAYGDFPLEGKKIEEIKITPGNNPKNPEEYDYWDHVRFILQTARQYNLLVGLLPCWGEYVTPRFRYRTISSTVQGYNYGHFIGKWLKDYNDHIIWILGGDRLPDEQPGGVDIWRAMAEGITDAVNNEYNFNEEAGYASTFMTYHCYPSSWLWFADDAWIDMHTWGSYHGERNFERAFYQGWDEWNRKNHKPFVNSEPAYENIPVNYDYKNISMGRFDAFDVRQIAYWSVFAGAAGHTYGAHEVFQMYKEENPFLPMTSSCSVEWDQALLFEGAGQMIHLKNLIMEFDFFSRHPHQSLLAKNIHDPPGRLVACSGKNYSLVYIPTGKNIELNANELSGEKPVYEWYNPRTGCRQEAAFNVAEGLVYLDPPGEEKRGNDWVLIIEYR
ncbi:MAG: glycoside hydrolase family 140 protein [Bacteroidales bacterium]|nr:glycoside hydrolase family 140 protein [Bacteroidales bacterium]